MPEHVKWEGVRSGRPDIAQRLRQIKEQGQCDCTICDTAWDAANAIERLRAAGDALAAVLRSGSDLGWDNALDAWEDARG